MLAKFSAEDSDCNGEERVGYPPGAPGSYFVSAEEPNGQVEDGIECGKVITCSIGSAGPEPSK